jgi:hypothetical protein
MPYRRDFLLRKSCLIPATTIVVAVVCVSAVTALDLMPSALRVLMALFVVLFCLHPSLYHVSDNSSVAFPKYGFGVRLHEERFLGTPATGRWICPSLASASMSANLVIGSP